MERWVKKYLKSNVEKPEGVSKLLAHPLLSIIVDNFLELLTYINNFWIILGIFGRTYKKTTSIFDTPSMSAATGRDAL